MSSFKKFLNSLLDEETTSADIAVVTNKLNLSNKHLKHAQKGKKCKKHKQLNCEICEEERFN